MKRKLAVLITTLAIGALALIAIPSVSAEPALNEQETIFVAKLAAGSPPIVPSPDRTAWELAQLGHAIADDVGHGTDPREEQDYMDPSYGHRSLTWKQDSDLVVTAVRCLPPTSSGITGLAALAQCAKLPGHRAR